MKGIRMFENLTTDGLEGEEDRLGGFVLLDTGLYDGVIKMARLEDSTKTSAKSLVVTTDYGDHEMRETIWFTNGKGENFYERNGKKFMLPGFQTVNSLALMATGHPFTDQTFEEKTVNVWDNEARKELPKSVMVMTSVLTKPITAAVTRQIVNKQAKGGDGK